MFTGTRISAADVDGVQTKCEAAEAPKTVEDGATTNVCSEREEEPKRVGEHEGILRETINQPI